MTTPARQRTGRSAASLLAVAMAALALGVGGLALWTARAVDDAAADRQELLRLQLQIDSLQAVVAEVVDPFGPTTPDPAPLVPQQPAGP